MNRILSSTDIDISGCKDVRIEASVYEHQGNWYDRLKIGYGDLYLSMARATTIQLFQVLGELIQAEPKAERWDWTGRPPEPEGEAKP